MENKYLHTIKQKLNDFEPVSLSSMDNVRLMDRVDSKFIISFDELLPVIDQITQNYFVLTINNNRIFSYRTEYFDTPDLEMFADHHNGKLNRYKIRQREYIESEIRFLEVKFKSNKGRVIKERVEIKEQEFSNFNKFILKHTPYSPENLKVSLVNKFNRFTLVDKNMQERVTIDLNLYFSDDSHVIGLDGLVIIEIKQNKNSRESRIYNSLKELSIRPDSFSKYCLGVALLDNHNKTNNFKRTINLIHKLSHVETNVFAKTSSKAG